MCYIYSSKISKSFTWNIVVQALNLASDLRSQINELDSIVNEGVRAAEKQGGKTMQAR